jgi:hypothetical protein
MDRQDELALIIGDASEGPGPLKVRRLTDCACAEIAAAVRSYMGSDDVVERAARAISTERGLNPDCLYQHEEYEPWPADEREEYPDAFSGEKRVRLMHRAWRRHANSARAALSAALDIGGDRG